MLHQFVFCLRINYMCICNVAYMFMETRILVIPSTSTCTHSKLWSYVCMSACIRYESSMYTALPNLIAPAVGVHLSLCSACVSSYAHRTIIIRLYLCVIASVLVLTCILVVTSTIQLCIAISAPKHICLLLTTTTSEYTRALHALFVHAVGVYLDL